MKPKRIIMLWLYIFGVSGFFIIISTLLLSIGPSISSTIIKNSLTLTSTSNTYELWKETFMPIYINFYFFNWTNPHEINNSNIKPHFQELGPYIFRETEKKIIVKWNKNGTVTYKHLKKWYFTGIGNLLDEITTINPVALTAAYTSRDWNYFLKKGLSVSLESLAPTVHITKTVKEMLFDGYEDKLITMAKNMPFMTNIPEWDKFGWFYMRNGSEEYDGVFNMGTGINSEFGRLYSWKYMNVTNYYNESCNLVNGSAGEFFQSNPSKTSIYFFSYDLCRSIALDYTETEIINNIVGNKYSIGSSFLDNGTVISKNKCYCLGDCMPSGTLNVSQCKFGSPSFVSLPHFYKADPYYTNLIDGMAPKKEKHDFYITLEPNTGIPLDISARLQINLLLQPITDVRLFTNIPKLMVPMLWFEQTVQIPNDLSFNLRLLLNLPVIFNTIGIIVLFIGIVLMICSLYKIYTTRIYEKKTNEKCSRGNYHEQIPLNSSESKQFNVTPNYI